ncbi:type II toxin-antitoxin system VapC family toxin [Saccharicrinis sp. FJH2]|uniref:type II toxin-antitoxin system VapC family toxin n=1 Tax=Saccharicrinis sp. FJH65 TaxID=3344659 RepID=UPI0035F38C18
MKDRLFFDTNVVLDLLGEREPFYDSAAKITTLADRGEIELIVSALTYSTVYYLLSRFEDKELVKEKIRKFKVIAETSDLTDKIVEKGLSSKFSDFEDALQYYCAIKMDCKILITRNIKDFKESEIPVLTPDEYLNSLRTK